MSERIDKVESVADDLFEEWEEDMNEAIKTSNKFIADIKQ